MFPNVPPSYKTVCTFYSKPSLSLQPPHWEFTSIVADYVKIVLIYYSLNRVLSLAERRLTFIYLII